MVVEVVLDGFGPGPCTPAVARPLVSVWAHVRLTREDHLCPTTSPSLRGVRVARSVRQAGSIPLCVKWLFWGRVEAVP